MKFKLGDLVEGNGIEKYNVTKKDNGFGKVIIIKEISVEEDDICVLWTKKGETRGYEHWVNSRYFKLKNRRWRDEV